jgi:Arm DNA-binding domain/Phage integrase central domain
MLTIKELDALQKPGMYGDGDGLYVKIAEGGGKSFVFRFKLSGRTRYMGLGGYPDVSLADARKKADEARKLTAQGIDPIVQRDTELARTQVAQKTFQEAAEAYYADKHMAWTPKAGRIFGYIFANHVFPVIGDMRVADVGKSDVLRVLKNTALHPGGFWFEKTPTARRCQGMMKAVLDYGTTGGMKKPSTRRRGRVTSTKRCRNRRKSIRPSTIRHCHGGASASSWSICARSATGRSVAMT